MMKKVAGRLGSFGPATYFGKSDIGLGNKPIDYYLMPEQSIYGPCKNFSIGAGNSPVCSIARANGRLLY